MASFLPRTSLGLILLSAVAALPACGDDGDDPAPTTTSTTNTTTTTGEGGADGEGGGGTGGGGAGGGTAAVDFPDPIVAGTPETDALADAPAQCGQPAHAWRKDLELGRISAHESQASYSAAVLEALLGAAVGDVPLELRYDVEVHLVTYLTQDRGQEIEATTLVAWPVNVPADAEALPTLRPSTGNMVAFYGASSGWYGAGDDLAQVFVPPLDADVPAALAGSCNPGDLFSGASSLEEIFQPEVLEAAAAGTYTDVEPWGCMGVENGLTTTSIARIQQDPASYGILFVTGEADETLCNAGMPVQYLECAEASHTDATTWALPEIVTFLQARLAGEAFAPSCEASAPETCQGTQL
jgi:hypothetical protein